MLIAGFPAGSFGANCYVIAPGAGERCVVVDPGQDAVADLNALLAEHRLRPAAVVLTHGHLDHMWSVTPVCGAHDVPAFIHPADRFLLADPLKGVSAQFAAFVGDQKFTEPDEVRELADGEPLGLTEVLGFDLVVDHAPGHTKGSVTFTLPGQGETGDPDVMFSGDLLFAGSIGRSDLPGGDPAEMEVSLARVVLARKDDTLVLPGHGSQTTIGRERASNPFLQSLKKNDSPVRGLKNVDSARPGL